MSKTFGQAFVVLVDKTGGTCGMFVDGDTCLNQIARLASFIGRDTTIAITYGLGEWKWKGKGLRQL